MQRTRPTFAQINLFNLQHNYQQAKRIAPEQVYAVIKADAYGHGAIQVAQALAQADGFAVACVDEALTLRNQGIKQAVVVLQGAYSQQDWLYASMYDLQMVVHHEQQLSQFKEIKQGINKPIKIWLKVNTGMNRLGVRPHQVALMIEQIQQHNKLQFSCCMTHHAASDHQSLEAAKIQLGRFNQVASKLPTETDSSTANSGAILSGIFNQSPKADAISRAGIMLYGGSPLGYKTAQALNLKPVMSLYSQVISLYKVQAGEGVGYGPTFVADKEMHIAVVAIGYGDGYPRHANNGTRVYIENQYCALVGRVSMDMICVDVSDTKDVKIGSQVELWGEHISADEVASCSQTIAYELFCQLTPRVPRRYVSAK